MHLLLIITDYGSFNNFLSDLAVAMVKRGHKVDVICSKDKVIDIRDKFNYANLGIAIHFVSFPRGFNIFKQYVTSIKINNLVQRINPDFVHIHFTTGIFTTVLYKKLNYKSIGTFHGLGFPVSSGLKRYLFKAIESFCFSRLDQIWVLNKLDYDIIQGANKKKTFMLDTAGVGCDLSRFEINNVASNNYNLKSQLKISENDFVITFTGRFVKFKGFDLVVRSFLEMNKRFPSTFKLILIGGNDSIHRTGLSSEEEAEYLVSTDIIKVGFTDQVEKYLSITDVFLFPSLKEGMPVCIIEALAMGVPTVTADSRGCNDLVITNKNGILLSNQPDVQEVIDSIVYLKNSPDVVNAMRAYNLNNRNSLGRDKYIDKQIEQYNKIFNS